MGEEEERLRAETKERGRRGSELRRGREEGELGWTYGELPRTQTSLCVSCGVVDEEFPKEEFGGVDEGERVGGESPELEEGRRRRRWCRELDSFNERRSERESLT